MLISHFKVLFLINRVGYRAGKKNLVCEKKSKISHNFLVTKATNYIFKKYLKNSCRNMCHTLIFVNPISAGGGSI